MLLIIKFYRNNIIFHQNKHIFIEKSILIMISIYTI